MATTRAALRTRVEAVCLGAPFDLTLAKAPFDFKSEPNAVVDGAVRVTLAQQQVRGRLGMYEEAQDECTIWVARSLRADAHAVCLALETELQSLRAAVIRDGLGDGDFAVVDGGSASIEHAPGQPFVVGRLALLINYETQV